MSASVRPDLLDPPPGTYVLDGRIYVRRFGPVKPRHIECRLGHPIKARGRPITSTPQCDHHRQPDARRCPAHLYLYRLSDLRYLSLDITQDEADLIHRERMDFDDVIAYFKLDMPRLA